jgi:Mg-chelatase subunit ChlD
MIHSSLTIPTNRPTAALRIKMPAQEAATPMHLIALLDTSDSMSDGNKLDNVKHCMSLVLRVLSPADRVSIITFGDQASVLLENIPTDGDHSAAIGSAIQQIRTDGCTNLSDGLIAVRGLLDRMPEADRHRKPLLLLLTDGHANRGVSAPSSLLQMLQALQESHSALAITSIAYGTDHNAELLSNLAHQSAGAYSIIQTLEDAALTIGDALGSAMSCVYQGVRIEVPEDAVVHGPYKRDPNGQIKLGDGNSGTETLILLDLPQNTDPATIKVHGVRVPTMELVSTGLSEVRQVETEDPVVELTMIRYELSSLFLTVREWTRGTTEAERARTLTRVNELRDRVNAATAAAPALVDMLKMEIDSLLAAIGRMGSSQGTDTHLGVELTQHAIFTSWDRGTTRAIAPAAPAAPRPGRRIRFPSPAASPQLSAVPQSLEEDPNGPPPPLPPVPMARHSSVLSPSSTARQREVADQLRSLSQQP